jgi:hypothetical protein
MQMIMGFLFVALMWLFLGLIIIYLFILIMHFLMPKVIIETYFKPPYFKEGECVFFTGIPYSPIRTVMFMRVLGFPESGMTRGLTEAYKLAPSWYRTISKLTIYTFILNISLLLIIFSILIIHMSLID